MRSLPLMAVRVESIEVCIGVEIIVTPGPLLITVQATSLCWSPDSLYLTVLEERGSLQLWTTTESGLSLAHSFEAHSTISVQWHSQKAKDGTMLLARYNTKKISMTVSSMSP